MPTHFQGDADTVRALSAYINLVRASDSMMAKTTSHLEGLGVTTGQFAVLEALLHLGPMCQHTLGKKLLRSGGNVTLVVDNLERHGWVRRERQVEDRRMIQIHLTPKGRRLITRVFPEHAKVVAEGNEPIDRRGARTIAQDCAQAGPRRGRTLHRTTKEGEGT